MPNVVMKSERKPLSLRGIWAFKARTNCRKGFHFIPSEPVRISRPVSSLRNLWLPKRSSATVNCSIPTSKPTTYSNELRLPRSTAVSYPRLRWGVNTLKKVRERMRKGLMEVLPVPRKLSSSPVPNLINIAPPTSTISLLSRWYLARSTTSPIPVASPLA